MDKLVIISGKATNGKDETAKWIRSELENNGKKCLRIAVGDSLKNICSQYYNWDGNKDEAGRTILQYVGTDVCRKNNPHVFTNILIEIIKAIHTDFDYMFVCDVRMPDEIDMLKETFGNKVVAIRVTRVNYVSPLTKAQQNHITEIALDDYNFDINIKNDTLEKLKEDCKVLAQKMLNNEL